MIVDVDADGSTRKSRWTISIGMVHLISAHSPRGRGGKSLRHNFRPFRSSCFNREHVRDVIAVATSSYAGSYDRTEQREARSATPQVNLPIRAGGQ